MGSGWDRDMIGVASRWTHNLVGGWRRGVVQVRLEIGGGATVSDSDGVMQMHGGRRSCKGSRWHRGGIGMGSGWYHDGLTNWSGGWRRGVMQVRLEMGGGATVRLRTIQYKVFKSDYNRTCRDLGGRVAM